MPMATARPPSVIEFTETPNHLNVSIVIPNESGIAVSVMNVVRKLSRKRNRTTVTMTAPSAMAFFKLPMAFSIKSACRKSSRASTPSGSVFCNSATAVSTFVVSATVSKPGDFVILMITPRLPFTLPSPRIGSIPQSTFATSAMVTLRSPFFFTTVLAMSSSCTVMARLRTMTSVVLLLMNPPVVFTADSRAAVSSSSKVTPCAAMRFGSGMTCTCLIPPPMLSTSAMPAMLCRRGRMVQSASVRTSRGSVLPSRLLTPTSAISPMREAAGVRNGSTPRGSEPRTPASRSCTNCRAL